MTQIAHSTIAQAIYADSQSCSFVRVITELETLLSRRRNAALRTRWDYEDVVVFDLGETRIVLGWSDERANDAPACLLISVGPLPSGVASPHDPTHEMLCSRLVERIQTMFPPDAVLWRQLPMPIEPELVDALIDALPSLNDVLPHERTKPEPAARVRMRLAFPAANETPDLPRRQQTELDRVRAALYPPEVKAPGETVQLRLAAQAINATLIVVWMPLGVAAMSYSLIKGASIGFSARMIALAGSALAWSQTPFGQQVAALAGA